MQIVSPRLAQTAPMTPFEFGTPAAWYDASAAGSLLDASNVAVADFGKIATFKDTSGNSPAGERHLLQGTDGSRPLYLPWSGTNYGYTAATGTTNYFSTPDGTGPNVIRSAFTLTAKLTPTSWAPSVPQYLFSYGLIGSTFTCSVYLDSDGKIYFNGSTNGTSDAIAGNSAALGFTDGAAGYVRITRNSSGVPRFYKSANGTDWTNVTASTSGSGSTLYNTTADFILCGYAGASANSLVGAINWMTLHSGYDSTTGTLALYFNPADYINGSTFTASTGEVWTLNGNALIVARAGVLFDGADDYLKSATFALAQPESVYCVAQQITWTSNDKVYDGYSVTERMALLQSFGGASPEVSTFAGTTAGPYLGWEVKTTASVFALFNGANGLFRVNAGTASAASTNTQSANGFTLGAAHGGTAPGHMLISEIVIFPTAHDTWQQLRMVAYLARKWRFAV